MRNFREQGPRLSYSVCIHTLWATAEKELLPVCSLDECVSASAPSLSLRGGAPRLNVIVSQGPTLEHCHLGVRAST